MPKGRVKILYAHLAEAIAIFENGPTNNELHELISKTPGNMSDETLVELDHASSNEE